MNFLSSLLDFLFPLTLVDDELLLSWSSLVELGDNNDSKDAEEIAKTCSFFILESMVSSLLVEDDSSDSPFKALVKMNIISYRFYKKGEI